MNSGSDSAADEECATYESSTGLWEWQTCGSGGSTSPGGSNADVQFNNNGTFGGEPNFSYNSSLDAFTMTGNIVVVGNANENQLLLTGNAGQTADIFVAEVSTGADVLTVATGGVKITGGLEITANLTAPLSFGGRGLTVSGQTIQADSETYSDTKCLFWENPVATDDFKSIWFAKQAATITSLWCESDQTVTAMFQVDDGSASDVDTVDLTCDSTPPEDTSLDGDTTLASGDRLDIDVASVASTPTWVSMCFTFSYDD